MAAKLIAFLWAYVKVNLATALEYRVSLVSQLVGMFLNDLLWVLFWALYFTKFPVLKGWTLEDVMVLWASVAFSFGLVTVFAPNSMRIHRLVVAGQLDYYLALPKDVLLHLLVSQIAFAGLGDLLFGPILLVVMVKLSWVRVAIYLGASLLSAILLLGYFVASGSMVFFLGNSEGLSDQLGNAMTHLGTYPASIFSGRVKLILYTLIPAGFISTVPVDLVREFHWPLFLALAGAACLFLGLAVALFRVGLRRYESGSLMMMRS